MTDNFVKAGRYILTTDNKVLLIGNVNEQLGECSCCQIPMWEIEAVFDQERNPIEVLWQVDLDETNEDYMAQFNEHFGDIKAFSRSQAIQKAKEIKS